MNIFKTKGFDSLIGAGTLIHGPITVKGTLVVDGEVTQGDIKGEGGEGKSDKSGLLVNGKLSVGIIALQDLTVTGRVDAKEVVIQGTLAVRSGATLKAERIYYRFLVVEPKAVLLGELIHLDHSPAVEEAPM
jgi:cytoskeletal protein CcmA (bactofilin family)